MQGDELAEQAQAWCHTFTKEELSKHPRSAPSPSSNDNHTFILTSCTKTIYYAFIIHPCRVSCKLKTLPFICVLHYPKKYTYDSWLLKFKNLSSGQMKEKERKNQEWRITRRKIKEFSTYTSSYRFSHSMPFPVQAGNTEIKFCASIKFHISAILFQSLSQGTHCFNFNTNLSDWRVGEF